MPLATAALDVRAARRIIAAAIAAALQGIFYWLILHEAIEPTARPTSTPLEVAILRTVRRLEPATPLQKNRQRMPRRQAEPTTEVLRPPEVTKTIPLPQAAKPAAHAPVDWHQAMQGEVRAEQSRSRHKRLQFGFPRQQPAVPEAPEFGWDYAHTHRLELLPRGGMLVNLTDRCALVVYGLLIPVCKIGVIPVNRHLFDHMHDRPSDRPGGLP